MWSPVWSPVWLRYPIYPTTILSHTRILVQYIIVDSSDFWELRVMRYINMRYIRYVRYHTYYYVYYVRVLIFFLDLLLKHTSTLYSFSHSRILVPVRYRYIRIGTVWKLRNYCIQKGKKILVANVICGLLSYISCTRTSAHLLKLPALIQGI